MCSFLHEVATSKPDNPVSIATVRGYRSAIGAVHRGFMDGSTVSSNSTITTLLRGIFHTLAVPRKLRDPWDLPLVLECLSRRPYEPLQGASLRNLTLKTVFLLQVASARRVSWTYSCRVDPAHLQLNKQGVRLFPQLALDKNQTESYSPGSVYIPSLKEISPDDRLHCPVRALKFYLDRTKSIRGDQRALFITSQEPYKAAAKNTIAAWVRAVIRDAYSRRNRVIPDNLDMRAHSTRSVATSWAEISGVSLPEIMDAAAWSTPVTFVNVYLKDLPFTRGRFAAGVLTTAAANISRKKTTPA